VVMPQDRGDRGDGWLREEPRSPATCGDGGAVGP
jgi:hypothetical protein